MCSSVIFDIVQSGRPAFIGRFGSTEIKPVVFSGLPFLGSFDRFLLNRLCKYSGFFPSNLELLPKFVDLVRRDMVELDVLGSWRFEELFLKKQLKDAVMVPLPELEPYRSVSPWSKALEGKRVLVVHPFAQTILSQYEHRDKLFGGLPILSGFKDFRVIKAVQSLGGQCDEFESWFAALEYMKAEISAVDFDVAIIGAGAYGFNLGAHVKRLGRVAVHLGGATQIMFGIRGKRWDSDSLLQNFYNEFWVYPDSVERPAIASAIEGGCYW